MEDARASCAWQMLARRHTRVMGASPVAPLSQSPILWSYVSGLSGIVGDFFADSSFAMSGSANVLNQTRPIIL